MADHVDPRPIAPAPAGRATTIRYLAAVCLLPLIVLWRQDNILFTGYGFIDPWEYFGYFHNLVEFKRTLMPGNSIGTHLSWILPGFAIHRLLSPVAAACTLHLAAHTVACASLFLTLKWVVGARRSFAAALLFSLNPWIWMATAWDYPDGISIAYCLLTMALLTFAALAPVRRGTLLAAGMALALLVYSNSDWIILSPLLPVYYLGLARWRGVPPANSFWALCRWFGPGCVTVTVALGAVNYRLEGHFWFYASPVLELLHRNDSPAPWWRGLWQQGAPAFFLLFTISALAVSLAVLVPEGRNAFRRMTPAILFSWQFLAALAWMILGQIRGNGTLGEANHASILLPFSFLVIGARFWPELEGARPRNFLIFCCIVAVVLSLAWCALGVTWTTGLEWIGIVALVASLLWRRFPEDGICALAGFLIFTVLGVGICYGGVVEHGYREQYRALCQVRNRVETVRQGGPVRFWFDKDDPAVADGVALVSSYSWDSVLSQSFRVAPCGTELAPGTIIAAIGSDALHGAGFIASTLTACWSGRGLRVVPVETDTIQRGAGTYLLSLARVESASKSQ